MVSLELTRFFLQCEVLAAQCDELDTAGASTVTVAADIQETEATSGGGTAGAGDGGSSISASSTAFFAEHRNKAHDVKEKKEKKKQGSTNPKGSKVGSKIGTPSRRRVSGLSPPKAEGMGGLSHGRREAAQGGADGGGESSDMSDSLESDDRDDDAGNCVAGRTSDGAQHKASRLAPRASSFIVDSDDGGDGGDGGDDADVDAGSDAGALELMAAGRALGLRGCGGGISGGGGGGSGGGDGGGNVMSVSAASAATAASATPAGTAATAANTAAAATVDASAVGTRAAMAMDSDAGALELMAAGRALGLRGCVSSMSRRPKKAEKTEEELMALEAKIDAVFDRCKGEEEKEMPTASSALPIRVKPATPATPTTPATPPATPPSLVSPTSSNASVAASPSPEKAATGTPSPARRKSGIPKPRPSGLKAPQQRRASKGKPSPGS